VAYDEVLAERVRDHLATRPDVSERKMFGGLCFLVGGNMCVGVMAEDLMVRVGKDAYAEALARPHAREMDFTGRVARGIVYVGPAGFADEAGLETWVDRGVAFAASLPPK